MHGTCIYSLALYLLPVMLLKSNKSSFYRKFPNPTPPRGLLSVCLLKKPSHVFFCDGSRMFLTEVRGGGS